MFQKKLGEGKSPLKTSKAADASKLASRAPSLKQALKSSRTTQSRPASRALAYGSVMAGMPASPMSQRVVVKGRDYMKAITIPTTGKAVGSVLAAFAINPSEWDSTRVGIMSHLYENWEVESISVVYEPACATVTPGQVGGFFDRDALDSFTTTSENNVRRAASTATYRAGPVWEPIKWTMLGMKDLTTLYTNTEKVDVHWSEAGLFQMIAATTLSSSEADYTIGTLYLEYSLRFLNPKMEPGAMGPASSSYSATGFAEGKAFGVPTEDCWQENALLLPLPNYTAVAHTNGSLDLPEGRYKIYGRITSTTSTAAVTVTDIALPTANKIDGGVEVPIVPFAHNNYVGWASDAKSPTAGFYIDFQCLSGKSRFDPGWITSSSFPAATNVYYDIFLVTPDTSNVLAHLNPEILGPKLMERHGLGFDFRPADWKVPVNLVKQGVDWLDSKGWTGQLSPVTKGFSKLVGWLLDLGIFNDVDVSDVPPALAEFWASCGYKKCVGLCQRRHVTLASSPPSMARAASSAPQSFKDHGDYFTVKK